MLIHKTIVEQHRDKKGDVLFRSMGVQIKSKIQITRFTKETFDIESFNIESFNIHLTFVCLREAVSAKAGTLKFGIILWLPFKFSENLIPYSAFRNLHSAIITLLLLPLWASSTVYIFSRSHMDRGHCDPPFSHPVERSHLFRLLFFHPRLAPPPLDS